MDEETLKMFILLLSIVLSLSLFFGFLIAKAVSRFSLNNACNLIIWRVDAQYRKNAVQLFKLACFEVEKELSENYGGTACEKVAEIRVSLKNDWDSVLDNAKKLDKLIQGVIGSDNMTYLALYDFIAKTQSCHNIFMSVAKTIKKSSTNLNDLLFYLTNHYPGDISNFCDIEKLRAEQMETTVPASQLDEEALGIQGLS